MQRVVYFVGTEAEVAHHAAPLQSDFDVRIVSADEAMVQAKPNELVVFFSEHFDRFRNAIVELKKLGVPTLYMIDGILEWRNAWENRPTEPACPHTMRPVLSDKVAVIGSSQARTLRCWGNEPKVEVVGIARLDSLRQRWLEYRCSNNPEQDSEQSLSPQNAKEFRVLVMTAKTPGFTDEQVAITKQSLIDLKTFFAANRKIDSRKIHVTWRLTNGLDKVIGVRNSINDLSGHELASELKNVDAVISTPSTAIVEAMLMRKPVASLDYHECPSYLPTAWKIDSPGKIDSIVRSLAAPPAHKILFQEAQLCDTIAVAPSATERLSQLIHSMLAVADESIRNNKPLQFDANLLSNGIQRSELTTVAPTLDHAKVFPDQPEFQQQDLLALQAQLSHSRREIEHLKRETTRLESELGQAHEIFEQIHSHPIAGPIVRLREKFMQFFRRRTPAEQAVKTPGSPPISSATTSSAADSTTPTTITSTETST